jgi:hypothetical protein
MHLLFQPGSDRMTEFAKDFAQGFKDRERSGTGENGNGEHPPRFKAGHSLARYANREIDPSQTLLGVRYLCRSGGMFVVAPSGMGKSTLSLQMAILWCCGLAAFAIEPNGKLRILIVQSEDDEGDCTEMSKVMNHLELTEEEKLFVEENTELVRCNDLWGIALLGLLRFAWNKPEMTGNRSI